MIRRSGFGVNLPVVQIGRRSLAADIFEAGASLDAKLAVEREGYGGEAKSALSVKSTDLLDHLKRADED